MPTWSARTAPTMRSSTKSVPPPTTCLRSTTSYAAGNIPTTVCVHTSLWPTSLHWNLSLAGNTILERQSVTNLLDEYNLFCRHAQFGDNRGSRSANGLGFCRREFIGEAACVFLWSVVGTSV